jgi:hypothetical protein
MMVQKDGRDIPDCSFIQQSQFFLHQNKQWRGSCSWGPQKAVEGLWPQGSSLERGRFSAKEEVEVPGLENLVSSQRLAQGAASNGIGG